MEGVPSHKGTLSVAENKLKELTKYREHLETERAKFAGRITERRASAASDNFSQLQDIADAEEFASHEEAIKKALAEENELRELLDKAKELEGPQDEARLAA